MRITLNCGFMAIERHTFVRVVAITALAVGLAACGSTDDASEPADTGISDPIITTDDSDTDSRAGDVDDADGGSPDVSAPDSRAGDVDDADGGSPDVSAPKAIDIPDIEMIDVASDETVSLLSLADGKRPVLLWFWAPH